jgi:pyridoxine 5'-phosphate synthase PdxJ
LDLGLAHRRPDPRHLRVRDGSSLRRHFTARVGVGSNVAQGFYAHAQEQRGAERWR